MIAEVSWNEHNGSFTEEEVYIERDGGEGFEVRFSPGPEAR